MSFSDLEVGDWENCNLPSEHLQYLEATVPHLSHLAPLVLLRLFVPTGQR